MFVLPQSSSIHSDFWYNTMGGSKNADSVFGTRFATPADLQRALWWYNGAMTTGTMAMPPLMSAAELVAYNATATAALREIFGGTPNPGHSASVKIGAITVPTLFVCGADDTALLCTRPYALETSKYCTGGYRYLQVDCGHDLLSCSNKSATADVIAAIVANVNTAETPRQPLQEPG
jgi:pimeloyl-ACP methyl ester carboxylesterase